MALMICADSSTDQGQDVPFKSAIAAAPSSWIVLTSTLQFAMIADAFAACSTFNAVASPASNSVTMVATYSMMLCNAVRIDKVLDMANTVPA